MGVAPSSTYFTDCLPYYFTKFGAGSQGRRIAEIYQPFAAKTGIATAELPPRPQPKELVRRTLTKEADVLTDQLNEAAAERIVTLGQEAADVLAALVNSDALTLRADDAYGTPRPIHIGGRTAEWLPLTHPGNHHSHWRARHEAWAVAQAPPVG